MARNSLKLKTLPENRDETRATSEARSHAALAAPSPWIERFAPLGRDGGRILDLACGRGRHVRFFLARGHPVTAVDRDVAGLSDLGDRPDLEIIQADLEDGRTFPLAGRSFDLIVVANYLHRPLLPRLVAAVDAGGLLLYETFAVGNERFGRPSNPDYLLMPGELLDAVAGQLRVLAYEDLIVDEPRPAAIQRICARRDP